MKTIQLFAYGFIALLLTNCQTESAENAMLNNYNSMAAKSSKMKTMIGHSVYVSSNNSGMLSIFNIHEGIDMPSMKIVNLPYMDADGVENAGN